MARKALDGLLKERTDIQVTEVEILSNPMRCLKDGVKFIPTLQCNGEQVSGIFLSHSTIKAFLDKVSHT
jgi:hypothetical protein